MFRNLIFDWSGTLVDDLGPVIEATNAVLAAYDRPPFDRETFRRSFRLPYSEFYQELLPDVPLAELEALFRPAFDAAITPVTILPHTREKLVWCKVTGIRTFVLSSMDETAFNRQMHEFGLAEYFEATYAGVLDKRALIHQLIERHGLVPAETAFVGDMTHDVETARHGGLVSIAVLTGYNHPEQLAAVRPDLTVPDLGVLRTMMENRNAALARPVVTVGALIQHSSGRLLMIRTHKWGHRWGIPGGKIERGESSEQALRREVMEETGLELGDIRFVLVQDCIDSPEFQRPAHFVLLNYFARTEQGDVTLNEEAEEFQWLSPTEALALDLNQPTRLLIEAAIAQTLITA
jgi:phosphoglycolate phosphatase-like HAD superfamily hydrolase/8-oxo-dGTP pyrophosphatase MutT (NUDIX family)